MSFLRAILTALCLLSSAPALQAQEPDWANADDPQTHTLVLERNREDMRFRDTPLAIAGREQGDNEFRSRTPALESNLSTEVARIDVDELYERKLAMYEEGARYAAPLESRAVPPSATKVRSLRSRSPSAGGPPVPPAESEPKASSNWLWLASLSLLALVVGMYLHRNGYLITSLD